MRRRRGGQRGIPGVRSTRTGLGENPETAFIQRPIREACRKLHIRCERNNAGLARSFGGGGEVLRLHSEGFWDLAIYLPGVGLMMVECKMPGRGLTPEQAAWGRVYRECGLYTLVAYGVEQFLRELEKIRNARREIAHV